MKYALILCVLLMGCAPKKPPLDETQMQNGKSIIIPPEYNVIPAKTIK